MDKELIKLLTKVFNKTEQEISEIMYTGEGKERIIKEGFSDSLIPMFENKIQTIKESYKDEKDNFYKKGQKEKAEQLEKMFKEVTGYDGDKDQFADMLSEYATKKPEKSKMTGDEIKLHPMYLELERSTVPKEQYESLMTEYDGFKTDTSRSQVMSKIKSKAWGVVEASKPKLPENSKVSENLRNSFFNSLNDFDYNVTDDQIIIMKDGKRYEDNLGNPVDFDSFIKSKADNWFEWNVTTPSGGTGNRNDPPASSKKFESKAEWDVAFNSAKDAKERVELGNIARDKGWLPPA